MITDYGFLIKRKKNGHLKKRVQYMEVSEILCSYPSCSCDIRHTKSGANKSRYLFDRWRR